MHNIPILRQLGIALFFLPLSGIAAAANDAKADEQAIRALDAQFETTAAKGDLDGQVRSYAGDAIMLPPDRTALRGFEAIRANSADFLKLPGLVLRVIPERIEVAAAGDFAVDTGRVEVEFDSRQGRVKSASKYLQVWRKTNGEWKIAYDTWNSNAPVQK